MAGAIAMVQGSATMNIPALAMVFFVFTPLLGFSRLILAIAGALIIGPIVVMSMRKQRGETLDIPTITAADQQEEESNWKPALTEAFRDWARSSAGYLVRMGPIMVVAGFASGLAIQWFSPETVSQYLGNDLQGVAIAATFGILINVPLLFEIPLVALLLLLGMGTAPAATLLFTAAAGGPITFWGLAKHMPKRAIATFASATWVVGGLGGVAVLGIGAFIWDDESPLRIEASSGSAAEAYASSGGTPVLGDGHLADVTPFRDIALSAMGANAFVDNWFPGIALFDYDRDGDLDIYVTSAEEASPRGQARGGPNQLFRNDGDEQFTEVAEKAGVALPKANSTGVVACDLDNDGFQDLYVASYGRIGDDLDYRSVDETPGLREVVMDHLFRNRGDGTFEDVTESAVGEPNIRSALSIACADVNGDGWLDIYVGNRADDDFNTFEEPKHHGQYNILYLNNRDFTFTDVTEEAGLLGGQIKLLKPDGQPLQYTDPVTGAVTVGFDPEFVDARGNLVGDPTGQTLAVMFFDYDSDGDPDLWQADDGDTLKVYRNDSTLDSVRFTQVESEMGIDTVGAWMGFALGDYDADGDLDVFVTNAGFHLLLHERPMPSGDCAYSHSFDWSTCYHFLLRNNGGPDGSGAELSGLFENVAPAVVVTPSGVMPPASLDPSRYLPEWNTRAVPPGLEAYEFGFGTTFLDMENDGDQDLYWLGSNGGRGEGPFGQQWEGAGRLMRNDGTGNYDDVTIESRVLDVALADYDDLDPADPTFDPIDRRLSTRFHENGKGVAKGDLNGDGYVDLIGSNSMGPVWVGPNTLDLLGGRLFVWLNGGGDNHWLTLQLRGRASADGGGSNADAVGARVFVRTGGGNGPETQVQDVIAGSSFISMSSTDLYFGLSDAAMVDEIEIRWPSGQVQVLRDIAADQVLQITEPET